jgi:hypothetical protein
MTKKIEPWSLGVFFLLWSIVIERSSLFSFGSFFLFCFFLSLASTTKCILDRIDELIDLSKHPLTRTTISSSDECIDLDELSIECLWIDPDKVENLHKPWICLTMEDGKEKVFESCFVFLEFASDTHRVDDHSLEPWRNPDIVPSSFTSLEVERWTREEIDQDRIIDPKTPKQVIDIARLELGDLDQDILRQDFSIAELLDSLLGSEHDIAVFFDKLVEHIV